MVATPPTGEPARPAQRNRALEIWLKNEHLSKKERLERLAADADLIADLRATNFEGEDWAFFANELARYGLAVIEGWMRRGSMKSKCAEKRITVPTLPAEVQQDPAAVSAIAGETVAEALEHFRDDVLLPNKWDPTKGASLKTFFIGQCMMRYANALRQWLNHDLAPDIDDLLPDDWDALTDGRLTGVEDDAIRTVTASLVLRGASSERAARALALDACGYTNSEIAADLGTTLDGVSGLLKRERARIRQHDGTPARKDGTG